MRHRSRENKMKRKTKPALVHSKLTPRNESRINLRQDRGSQGPRCCEERSDSRESNNGGPKRWPAMGQIPWGSRSLCGNRVRETKVVGTTPKLDRITRRSAESSVVEKVRDRIGRVDMYLCREIRLAKYTAIVKHIDCPEGTCMTPSIRTFIPPKQFKREHTCNSKSDKYVHSSNQNKTEES